MRSQAAAYSLIILAAAVSAVPVPAQGQAGITLLHPKQFSEVHKPDDMNVLERFGWAGLLLTGHPVTKGIVPTFGYEKDTACLPDVLRTEGILDALLLTKSGSVAGTLNDLCGRNANSSDDSHPNWKVEILDSGTEIVLLLTDRLGGKDPREDIDPVGEYWLRCAEEHPPGEGSACHNTFSLSPHDFQRELAGRAVPNR
ncbi:MAG: hypothetical protein OXC91_09800 [Rhodobacteraceae bacterium]|nr:hypothetical protein [Paracoccaceae bacterium]